MRETSKGVPVRSVQLAPESVEVNAALLKLDEDATATNVVPFAHTAVQLFALAAAIVVLVSVPVVPAGVLDVLTEFVVETITKFVPSQAIPRLVELFSTAPVVQDVASVDHILTVLEPETA